MTSILSTGLSGLVGSKFAQLYTDTYTCRNLDISNPDQPTDITDPNQVMAAFEASDATHVIHFAAFTDVTKAWEQRDDKNGLAYQVNVIGTQNIIKAAEATHKHLIHISTAYVFDGQKPTLYVETDDAAPIEWYGQTKWEAEQLVQQAQTPWTILRIDQPFRSDPFPKPDAVHKIITAIKEQRLYPQFSNHYFGPTFIDDFAKVMDWVIRSNTTGLFHASAGEQWSDFEFAKLINDRFNLGATIQAGDLDEYLKKTNRPYQRNTALSTEKLKAAIDFKMLSVAESLQQVQEN
jgi:dTDP-4-dehydrorhamnose reductase